MGLESAVVKGELAKPYFSSANEETNFVNTGEYQVSTASNLHAKITIYYITPPNSAATRYRHLRLLHAAIDQLGQRRQKAQASQESRPCRCSMLLQN